MTPPSSDSGTAQSSTTSTPEPGASTTATTHAGSWAWGTDNGVHNADASFVGEAPEDWAGGCLLAAGDLNGDGIDDLVIGAPRSSELAEEGGEVYFVFGGPNLTLHQSLVSAPSIVGDQERMQLCTTRHIGDLNADGLSDIAMDPGFQATPTAGIEYMAFGKAKGWAPSVPIGSVDVLAHNLNANGSTDLDSYVPLGDMTGDGVDDWLLAGPVLFNGEAHVVSGVDVQTGLELPDDSALWVYGDAAKTSFVGAGDLNGDGLADLLAHSPTKTRIVFGSATGLPHDQAAAAVATVEWTQRNGHPLAPAGDLNGDGLQDLIVASEDRKLLVLGRTTWPATLSEADADAELLFPDGRAFHRPVGDLNGDGIDDLVVTPPGRAEVVFGRSSWPASANVDVVIEGNPEATFQIDANAHGDLNGDGIPDLVIREPYTHVDGKEYAGALRVFVGRTTWASHYDADDADARFVGTVDYQTMGAPVVVTDLNGDGIDDLVVNSEWHPVGTGEGETFVFFGHAL